MIIILVTDGLWRGEEWRTKISPDWDSDWDFNINCLNEVTGLKDFRWSEESRVVSLHSTLLDNDFSGREIIYTRAEWGATFYTTDQRHCLNILLAMTIQAEYYNGGCGWHFLSCSGLEWQGYQNNIRGWLGTDSGWHSLHNDTSIMPAFSNYKSQKWARVSVMRCETNVTKYCNRIQPSLLTTLTLTRPRGGCQMVGKLRLWLTGLWTPDSAQKNISL